MEKSKMVRWGRPQVLLKATELNKDLLSLMTISGNVMTTLVSRIMSFSPPSPQLPISTREEMGQTHLSETFYLE